ncbi:MAG: helix-turn-helix transcriptional regulator [Propionibacterium sp.]|nr:helix-turn-helix transcriptional regulator [Propionibacterium sp.]
MAQGQREPRAMFFAISVAAELAGMHPQTLRQYDRLGLVTPARTKGRGRRYSPRDVQRLRDVQHMSQEEGINLAGIRRILDLEEQVERLHEVGEQLRARLDQVEERRDRVFAVSSSGVVSPLRRGQRASWEGGADAGADLVLWDPLRAAIAHRLALASIEARRPGWRCGWARRGRGRTRGRRGVEFLSAGRCRATVTP